ncbi:MAG: response regulator [Desulfobacterales bacterium]
MKILIAEDEDVSRAMLQTALEEWGYTVTSTSDGDEAWDALQETDAPQLAILDWMMPGRNGPALCHELRKLERDEPLYLILLTARGEGGDIVRGLEAGADDYIVKPYDSAELQARIDVGRRIIRLQDELREQVKLQGIVEMAGAVCHEMNQPMQVISGLSELSLWDITEDNPLYPTIRKIKGQVDRMGEITRKLMNIVRYETKDYLEGKIVDIDKAVDQA